VKQFSNLDPVKGASLAYALGALEGATVIGALAVYMDRVLPRGV
jgi:hypothetical protein